MRQAAKLLPTVLVLLALVPAARGEYPQPSPYPVTWELKFEHETPERIVVQTPGQLAPVAYWYMTYAVTNESDQERMWLPMFEMLAADGRVILSDEYIPESVFQAIKDREKNQFLQQYPLIHGPIRLGENEAREGVAIWAEPMPEMGRFAIFVTGLSGEIATVKFDEGESILRKTLQLNYLVRGDEVYPGEDQINEDSELWIMR